MSKMFGPPNFDLALGTIMDVALVTLIVVASAAYIVAITWVLGKSQRTRLTRAPR